jgi:PAS domain S-box-containing protein
VGLEQIIERQPLIVAPTTSALTVIQQMSQTSGQICALSTSGQSGEDQAPAGAASLGWLPPHSQPSCNYAVVVDDETLQGIFTERDLVKLVAIGSDWETAAIADVMTHPVIALNASDAPTIFTVLVTMQQHRIRHLPIVDHAQHLIGVVTQESIRRALQPFNFLKLRRVADVMSPDVVQADPTETLLQLAQRMTEQSISCLVITEAIAQSQSGSAYPIGIVTERDIIQFQAIGLDLSDITAQVAMSAPLFLIRPDDSLWHAHQEMQRRHTRRLVVVDNDGQLAGIVTQSNLLRVLDPLEMLREIEQLQQLTETQATELMHRNRQLQDDMIERKRLESALHHANQFLEERVGLQAAQLVQTNEALRYERDFTTAVLNTVGALVIVINREGKIVRVNHTCEQVTGYQASEMVDRYVWDFLLASESQETIQSEFDQLVQEQTSRHFETFWVAKDGSHVLIAWSNTVLEHESGDVQYIIATGIDITEQRQVEQQLEQQSRQNQLFADMTRKIQRSLRLDEILRTTTTEVQHLLRCDRVLMIQLQPDGSGIPVQEATKPHQTWLRDHDLAAPLFSADYLNLYQQSSIVTVNQLQQLDYQPNIKHLLEQLGVKAQLVVSIICSHQRWGLLVAQQCDRPRTWSASEIELMQQLADQIGVAVSQAQLLNQLEDRVNERTEQLMSINERLQREVQDRIKTEEALRESQQKLADILNIADVAIISINQRQCIEMFNQGAVQIFGYTLPEILGQPLDILLPEAFRQIHREHIRRFETSPIVSRRMGERSSEVFGRRKNGEIFPAEASISKLKTKDGSLFTVILKDITERQQSEQALRESEERFRSTFEQAAVGIAHLSIDFRWMRVNQKLCNILGYAQTELLERSFIDITHPDDVDESLHYIHQLLSDELGTYSLEKRYLRRDGNPVWCNVTVSLVRDSHRIPQYFVTVVEEITARKQAESTLRRSEEQLRLTTDALPVLISYVDANQRYLFNNQAYEDWFHQPASSFRDRHIRDVLGEELYQQIRPHVEAAIAGDRIHYESEFTHSNSEIRYLDTTYIPHVDDDGTVKGFFALISDISDRKATERLKDEFVSVVSHELRTPLTSIHGSLKLLATGQLGQLNSQGEGLLQIALKNTERLTRLINDVLDLERIEMGKVAMSMQICNAGELIVQAAQSVQSMATENNVTLSVVPANITLSADPDHILQTLINLLSNAVKFSPADSTVWVAATQRDHDVLFQVTDQGRGIPQDKLTSIFERFNQVDATDSRKRGGTGLGLTICKKIIQRHGGQIWAESTLGEGSTFYFTLPISSDIVS